MPTPKAMRNLLPLAAKRLTGPAASLTLLTQQENVKVRRLPADDGVLFRYALSPLLKRKLRSILKSALPCPEAPARILLPTNGLMSSSG